ncbi:MAG: SH3 type 3 domain protein [Microgenomates group bacterium GW2011_GWF2_47_9]|nr:MAG: SH3 type 3 domain protein [Microgenomates group bacterium GW2011_GWF2_47_9]
MRNSKVFFILFTLALSVGFVFGLITTKKGSPKIVTTSVSPSFPPTPVKEVTVLAVGDVMLGRSVNNQSLSHRNFAWPFLETAGVLRSADLTIGNLENPLVKNCPPHDNGFIFCAPDEAVSGLIYAGFDVVSLANNHATNYKIEGLENTKKVLEQNGILSAGLGVPAIVRRGDTDFAILAYNDIGIYPGVSNYNEHEIEKELAMAREQGDLVIVFFHWGEEYTATPTKRQVELAHRAIDLGADLVLGAHPHWVQTEEVYKDKHIFYSLGNFIFDQEWSQETKEGMAVRFTYQDKNLLKIDRLPVLIQNYGQPRFIAP